MSEEFAQKKGTHLCSVVAALLFAPALLLLSCSPGSRITDEDTNGSPKNNAYHDWLREAELGPYQPQEEDWNAILSEALTEPPLKVYSATTRAVEAIEQLNEKTGLRVRTMTFSTNELIERVRREWDAGIQEAGVVFVGNPAMVKQQLLSQNAVTRYVPRELEPYIEEHEAEPLLRHRYSVGTWYYTTSDGSESVPYENIWELTSEKWRGRVVMRDPLESGTLLAVFTALIDREREMVAAYEEYFNEPPEFGSNSAGLEFLKRLLANDPIIVPNVHDVAETVTEGSAPMVAISTQSLYRQVLEGVYDFAIDTEVNPTVLTLRLIGIVSMTDAPNQAKVVIRYLMSQEGGDAWWGADFPVNQQVTPTGPMAELTLDAFETLWEPSVDEMLDTRDEFIEFFLRYR